MDIHRFKTGRYSFSLPLEAGAILAGVSDGQELRTLRLLGETLGLIYQTADDGLSIFGKDAAIGKKVGNDIREDKQTLFIFNSLRLGSESERQRLGELYGKKDISEAELEEVRRLMTQTGAVKSVDEYLDKQTTAANSQISQLSLPSSEVQSAVPNDQAPATIVKSFIVF
jgi:geranylgeranyl diphosphate synthase type I